MPSERTTKKKPNMGASEKREKARGAIEKLNNKQDSEKNKKHIARLETILKKKDEELEATNLDGEMDGMDLGEDDIDETDTTKDSDDQAATAGDSADQAKTAKDNAGQVAKAKDNVKERGRQEKEKDAGKPKKLIKKERRDSESSLFVSKEEQESEPEDSDADSEYGHPLFIRPGPQPGHDVQTVGWTGGRRTMYINQYGPKNAAKHRLESFAESAEYEDEKPPLENVSNIHNRHGDDTLTNGKFRFTKRHIIAIYGVAWEGAGDDDSEADLALINPDLVYGRWPNTSVFIAWDFNGRIEKKWEPRQALRARWGKKQADKAIFEAACESEARYNEVQTGTRNATSRSPSVGLVATTARQFREQSLAADRASSSRARRSSPPPAIKSSKSKVSDATKAQWANTLEKFRADYCECAGVSRFKDLDPADQANFVKAWQHAKSEGVASA